MKLEPITQEKGNIKLSTDPQLIQLDVIYRFLTEESYWGKERTYEQVKTAVESSYSIGVYQNGQQIGYARLVTDFCFFAYMADVFILPQHQGKGYGKTLMQFIKDIPFIGGLRWFCLATRDAHGLYKQYGFKAPEFPELWMEIRNVPKETIQEYLDQNNP